MSKLLSRWLLGALILCCGAAASAQNTRLDNGQLDQLMAPVALYPDALLSQVLMASTYPDEVKEAAAWSAQNQSLSGDDAVKAVDSQNWDPSVKSLAAFPSVLDMMGRQPQWVEQVGDAFLDQPDDVMASAQRLRKQAQASGSLKSNEQQTVSTQTQAGQSVVVIEPANPQVVYVPQYNPTVVYGAWPYPAYPPYYYPPPVGSVFATSLVAGIGFGIGVAAVNSLWGGFNWGGNNVNINVNRYNNVNVNNRISANQRNWQHNPAHRGNAQYRSDASRQRFDSQRQAGVRDRAAGGRPGGGAAQGSRDAARERAAASVRDRTGQSIPGHDAGRAGQARDRAGAGGNLGERPGAGGARDHAGVGDRQGAGGARDRAGAGGAAGGARDHQGAAQRQAHDRSQAMDRSRAANHSNAFQNAGNADRARQVSQRGGGAHQAASRPAPQRAAPQRGGGGFHGGGGGGGGFHGGGGRGGRR